MKKLIAFIFIWSVILLFCKSVQAAPIETICADEMDLGRNNKIMQFPICTNHPIENPDPNIRRVVIVINGNNRNAQDYFNFVKKAADTAHVTDALIVAPQFLAQEDIDYHKVPNTIPYWDADRWWEGDDSLSSEPFTVSSYEVIDALILYVTDTSRYPNIQSIVLTGHSDGAVFLNRYAAGTNIERSLKEKGIEPTYVIANAPSYLYFTTHRRIANTSDQFARIEDDTKNTCLDYNSYAYGLDNLNPYMSKAGAGEIPNRYETKHVIYLLGTKDDDPNDDSLDTSCAANMQGSQRFERGTIFYNYLSFYYDKTVYNTQKKVIVNAVGHDAYAMFNSAQGRAALFPTLQNAATQTLASTSPIDILKKIWAWLTS